MVSTCVGTNNLWLLAVLHCKAGRSSPQKSSNTGLGNQNQFISQLSIVIYKQTLVFPKYTLPSYCAICEVTNIANAAIVNTNFLTTLHMLLHPPI